MERRRRRGSKDIILPAEFITLLKYYKIRIIMDAHTRFPLN
jgi:hypothetical protein